MSEKHYTTADALVARLAKFDEHKRAEDAALPNSRTAALPTDISAQISAQVEAGRAAGKNLGIGGQARQAKAVLNAAQRDAAAAQLAQAAYDSFNDVDEWIDSEVYDEDWDEMTTEQVNPAFEDAVAQLIALGDA